MSLFAGSCNHSSKPGGEPYIYAGLLVLPGDTTSEAPLRSPTIFSPAPLHRVVAVHFPLPAAKD